MERVADAVDHPAQRPPGRAVYDGRVSSQRAVPRSSLPATASGTNVHAYTALDWGLVNRVVPREAISEEVMKLATRIAKASPEALALTKRNLNRSRHIDLQTALDLESHMQPLMLLSEDHKAAIKKMFG